MSNLTLAATARGATVAAAVTLAACGGSQAHGGAPEAAALQRVAEKRPHGVVEDCSTRSDASFPGAFTDPENVVVGPLVLVGAARTPASTVREYGGEKFPALVRAGHRVTVSLPRGARRVAGLGYGPRPEGVELSPRDGHSTVTFIACGRRRGPPVSFWSGFVLTRSPRCVPLDVWVDDETTPRRTTLRMGVRRCEA